MSDPIELEQDNICITEDAFEKFQSTSMYEQEEFLTLSDLVSPQPSHCDVDQNEIFVEENGELSTNADVMTVADTVEISTCTEVEKNVEISSETDVIFHEEVEVSKNVEILDTTEETNAETFNNDFNMVNIIETTTLPSINTASNAVQEPVKPKRPRGRPRKVQDKNKVEGSTEQLDTSSDWSLSDSASLGSVNPNTNINSANPVTVKKKRGRKPKPKIVETLENSPQKPQEKISSTTENPELDYTGAESSQKSLEIQDSRTLNKTMETTTSEADSTNNLNSTVQDEANKLFLERKTSKRVSKKRFNSEDWIGDDDTIKLPIKTSIDKPDSSALQTQKKKRGRPRKVSQNNVGSDTSVTNNNSSDIANVESNTVALKVSSRKRSRTISKNKLEEITDKAEMQESYNQPHVNANEPKSGTIADSNEQNSDDDNLSLLSLKSKNSNPETSNALEANTLNQENSDETAVPSTLEMTVENETQESQFIAVQNTEEIEEPLISDTSGRPLRRVIRKPVHYDEGSDEDPFANVELSDDDGKKNRYYSDDEYVPHEHKKRKGKSVESDSSDSEILDELKKKKSTKLLDGVSPKKRGRKSKAEIEERLDTSVTIDLNENDDNDSCELKSPKANDAFESFLAEKIKGTNLQIKKVSTTKTSDNTIPALRIPTIDPKEITKTVETSCQTDSVKTKSSAAQTSNIYSVPMKTNVPLNKTQSIKACELLSNIVNTTVELGQLMTQKSEDFIKRKINIENVTDTLKMDYCVKKSFLLFKLAKHNLTQMEDDLTAQYSTFLKDHKLSWCRDEEQVIEAKPKEDSDSDCEIVGEIQQPQTTKPKFNPKTVFLNKELSIKVTKKPEEKKNLSIKGRNALWITKTVLLKKVKPTQSFLAQDSRNKKPPDQQFVTKDMVQNFFLIYHQNKIKKLCHDATSMSWLNVNNSCECYHFITNIDYQDPSYGTEFEDIATSSNNLDINEVPQSKLSNAPETLFKICTRLLQKQLHGNYKKYKKSINNNLNSPKQESYNENPKSLFSCCVDLLQKYNNKKITLRLKSTQITELNGRLKYETCETPKQEVKLENKRTPKSLSENCLQILNIKNHEVMNNNRPVEHFNTTRPAELKYVMEYFETDNDMKLYNPKTLISLSLNVVQNHIDNDLPQLNTDMQTTQDLENNKLVHCKLLTPKSLSKICINKIQKMINSDNSKNIPFKSKTSINNLENKVELNNILSLKSISYNAIMKVLRPMDAISRKTGPTISIRNGVKSLFSLCVAYLQQIQIEEEYQYINNSDDFIRNSPKQLKQIAFKNACTFFNDINQELEDVLTNVIPSYDDNISEPFAINSVNTLSEEAFFNIETDNVTSLNNLDESEYADDESDVYDEGNESNFNDIEDNEETCEESNWLSQVQLEDLRSCSNSAPAEQTTCSELNSSPVLVSVKTEPIEDILGSIDISIVKTETVHNPDEMTVIPDCLISKSEPIDIPDSVYLNRENNPSYDIESLETFLCNNKLMKNMVDTSTNVFSQSIQRVHRKHEPDYEEEFDSNNSLLIPQTYETINVVNAKDSLMESSSGEEGSSKKAPNKKKVDKRRGRQKKPDPKTTNKEKAKQDKGKEKANNEVDNLTKRMRDKIRQEEKKIEHSDSESETPLDIRKSKGNEPDNLASKTTEQIRQEEKNELSNSGSNIPLDTEKSKGVEVDNLTKRTRDKSRQEKELRHSDSEIDTPLDIRKTKGRKKSTVEINKATENKVTAVKISESEIQCNNVDSTQQSQDNNESSQEPTDVDTFMGFSTTDQSDTSEFQNYLKQLYSKLLPGGSKQKDDTAKGKNKRTETYDKSRSQIENPSYDNIISYSDDEVFDDRPETPLINYEDPAEELQCEPVLPVFDDIVEDTQKVKRKKEEKKVRKTTVPTTTSPKTTVPTTTSPKTTVTNESKYTEWNGWHCYPIDAKDPKLYQDTQIKLDKLPESFVNMYFQYQDIANKDHQDREIDRLTNLTSLNRIAKEVELGVKSNKKRGRSRKKDLILETGPENITPDQESNVETNEHELSPSEDEDNDDDDDIPLAMSSRHTENILAKDSLMNDSGDEENTESIKQEPHADKIQIAQTKKKPGPKCKTLPDIRSDQPLMLTADKVMNTELNLLHGPVVIQDEPMPSTSKGPVLRNRVKSKPKSTQYQNDEVNKDDSSSEEEKLWVNTKEKLLKRLEKKDNASVEDAKRAKLVTEFIERRGDGSDRKRPRNPKYRKSKKFLLEREKQLRSLSRELYGEVEDGPVTKKSGTSLFKGRRNIRKVIDKKSLRHRTVLANMEELERKRRLHARQQRLREHLGCEEDVNVMVINDEVCLEYDFEENRPVVTIHPFFTKVMKAHQYEGVKFMWDACFESLQHVGAGAPGSGCILAHCMGLGKTLQVLALLHTVLTHPGVGIQRVLVCCPLSTVLNWVDEIHKWIGPVTNQIKVFELSKLKKTYERAYQLEDWYNGGGIFIIGYELFRSLSTLDAELDDIRPTIVHKIRTALLDPGPDVIVCDEGHLLKNDCSVLAVAMSRVVTKRRIVLTGTPMQNNLREYYCMVNFIKPNLLGTYSEFSNRFENPIMNGQHRDSREEDIKLMKARTHILHKVLEGCLQRQEASVLYPYLPKKYEYTVFISLTQCQWDLYKHYLVNYAQKTKHSILKDFHILQKIWSHPQVLHIFHTKSRDEKAKVKAEKLEDDLAHEDITSEDIKPGETEVWWLQYLDGGKMLDCLESSNKFLAVFKILDECIELGDKVLIFSTSLFTLDALEYFVKKMKNWSLGHDYYRLDGSVPPEVRQKWCREFNAENNIKTKLFLISTRAGSLGLNLTAANRVIILDTSWNPAHDIQSIFRVYRFGQRKDCFIYRFVAMGTMEQKIYERSVTKQAVSCRVVDEQQIDRHYNSADLTELYRFDETGVSVAGGVAVGVADVALLRVARNSAIHAVHEHDSLLRGSSEPALPEHERAAVWMQFQQEQAHRQMQNERAENNKLLKTSTKVPGHEYAKSPVTYPLTDTSVNKTETAKKRGRKCQVIIPQQLIEDRTQNVNNTERKDDLTLIDAVVSILCKHHFKMHGGEYLIALINNVRNVFFTKKPIGDSKSVEIATMLLQQRDMTIPILTAIVCEAVKKCVILENFKKQAEVQMLQAQKQIEDNNMPSGSGTKKRQIESIIPDLIEDDDDLQIIEITPNEPNHLLKQVLEKPPKKIKTMNTDNSNIDVNLKQTETNTEKTEEPNSTQKPIIRRNLRSKSNVTDNNSIEIDQNYTKNNVHDSTYNTKQLRSYHKNLRSKKNTVEVDEIPQNNIYGEPDNFSKDTVITYENNRRRKVISEGSPKTNKCNRNGYDTNYTDSIILGSNSESSLTNPKLDQLTNESAKSKTENQLQKVGKIEIELENDDSTPQIEDPSILLSDDDEPVAKISKTKPSPRVEEPKPDQTVPLHPSLLVNENFIKIVAHTYLSGNPKLDQDAAFLAAQYSTLKALKEVEARGKLIDSGPIYDIAVKQLGYEILMKMHGKGVRSRLAKKAETSAASLLQKSLKNIENQIKEIKDSNTQSPRVTVKSDLMPSKPKPIMVKLNKVISGPARTTKEVNAEIQPKQINKNVVPVQMYKYDVMPNARPTQYTNEECILPDDDDIIIDDIIPEHYIYKTPGDIEISTSEQSANQVTAAPTKTITAKAEKQKKTTSTHPNSLLKAEAVTDSTNVPVTESFNYTICLDSDEESQPHPVSMSYTPAVTTQAPPILATPTAPSVTKLKPHQPYLVVGPIETSKPLKTYKTDKNKIVHIAPKPTPVTIPTPVIPPKIPPTITPKLPPPHPITPQIPNQSQQPSQLQPSLSTPSSVTKQPKTPKSKRKRPETLIPDLTHIADDVEVSTSEEPVNTRTDPRKVLENVVHIMANDIPQPEPHKQVKAKFRLVPVKKLPPHVVPPTFATTTKTKILKEVKDNKKLEPKESNGTRTYIDLTDIITSNAKPSGSGGIQLGNTMKVVGKPSNIALHSKKTICLITPPPSKSKTKESKIKTSSNVPEKLKPSKRPTPLPQPEPVKKKLAQMTLQDFDIDNIDDIIELD